MFEFRCASPADFPHLVSLWRRSVDATHGFLSPADLDGLEAEVLGAVSMPELEVWVACAGAQDIAGFMGVTQSADATMIEMLFIDPPYMGRGLGTRFIEIADAVQSGTVKLLVDVNEDNLDALGFYLARGFVRFDRSATDPFDRPYPILHLLRRCQACE